MRNGEAREGAFDMEHHDWLRMEANQFIRHWYASEYSHSAYSGGAAYVQARMHRSLERGYNSRTLYPRTLELGGNRGEHLQFIQHAYQTYVLTDLNVRLGSPQGSHTFPTGVQLCEADAQMLPFLDECFDRIVHTCLLHHVSGPEDALKEIRRVLRPGGTADLFLSSDPGLLFRMARWLGPVQTARAKGLRQIKRLVDARDHINHVGALRVLIRHVFQDDAVQERRYPLGLPGWNLSLWQTYRITKEPTQ